MEITKAGEESQITNFYKGKNVFITGATGFMGKVLIEKLLRSCKDIGRIYVMARQKRGKTIEQRIHTIFENELFSRVKIEHPTFLDKITAVAGDVGEPALGLNEKDRERLINDVDIVFHAAATVNFDEKIKMSVNINIRGTEEILKLCRECLIYKYNIAQKYSRSEFISEFLEAVIHVSTAYANCNRRVIDEQIYEPRLPADSLVEMTRIMNDELLDSVTPQIIGEWPNTYAFTKQVAEDAVLKYGKGLPVAIFRPSIIIGSSEEPVPGWIDNLYGPTGICVAVGHGIMRTAHSDPTKLADIIPVDYCVNGLITLAWDVGSNREKDSLDIPVYNYVSSCDNPITWGEYFDYTMQAGNETPCSKAIWYYTLTLTKSRFLFGILCFLLHTLPAVFFDLALLATNNKRRLRPAYAKIHRFLDVISFFSTKQWKFDNGNVRALWNKLNEADRKAFNFDMTTLDWPSMLKENIKGIRQYLLNDPLSTVPAAKRRMFILYILHRTVQVLLLALFLFFSYGSARYFFRRFVTLDESNLSNEILLSTTRIS